MAHKPTLVSLDNVQLGPDDKTMDGLERKYKMDTKQKIRSLGSNALAEAGALVDDEAPNGTTSSSNAAAKAEEAQKDFVEQRILLVQALLSIGHLPPAMYILSRWPVIPHYQPVISDLLLRIVRYMLEPAYSLLPRKHNDPSEEGELVVSNSYDHARHLLPDGSGDEQDLQAVEVTLIAPEPRPTLRKRFEFFFSCWKDRLPKIERLEDVKEGVRPWMAMIGAMGARDVTVLVWLCRIGVWERSVDVSLPSKC